MRTNPVFKKELKVKARSWRFPFSIALFIIFLISFTGLIMMEMFSSRGAWGINISDLKSLYMFLFIFLMVIISIVVPSTASNAICGEKSRKTFDLLISSRLNASSIVVGKLLATISHTMILLVVSMPFFVMFYLFGIIDIKGIVLLFAYYLIYALLCGSVGLYFSSICNGAVTSTIGTYVTGLTMTLFNIFVVAITYNLWEGKAWAEEIIKFLVYANPLTGFAGLLEIQFNNNILVDIFEEMSITHEAMAIVGYNILILVGMSIILLWLTSRNISPYKKTLRRK